MSPWQLFGLQKQSNVLPFNSSILALNIGSLSILLPKYSLYLSIVAPLGSPGFNGNGLPK